MAELLKNPVASDSKERRIQSSAIRRSPDQAKARVQRARMAKPLKGDESQTRETRILSQQGISRVPQTVSSESNENSKDQERVNRVRFFKAQGILAAQEEAYVQIEKEEGQKPSPIRYAPAGAVAILKDFILDPTGLGSLPVIGTVVSLICAIMIFFLVLFAKKNGSLQDMGFIIKRLLIVAVSFLIEGFVFGVNFFPFEIATVAIIYFMDKHLTLKQIMVLRNITYALGRKPL